MRYTETILKPKKLTHQLFYLDIKILPEIFIPSPDVIS